MDDRVREMMAVIVEQLKAYVDGNEEALVELTEVLDSGPVRRRRGQSGV